MKPRPESHEPLNSFVELILGLSPRVGKDHPPPNRTLRDANHIDGGCSSVGECRSPCRRLWIQSLATYKLGLVTLACDPSIQAKEAGRSLVQDTGLPKDKSNFIVWFLRQGLTLAQAVLKFMIFRF